MTGSIFDCNVWTGKIKNKKINKILSNLNRERERESHLLVFEDIVPQVNLAC